MAKKTTPTKVKATKKVTKKAPKPKTSRKKKATSIGLQNNTVNLSSLKLSKEWNRRSLGDISDLVSSITAIGLVKPILVRKVAGTDDLVVVDGRRRLAAMQKIGISAIPVTVSQAQTDKEARVEALVANLMGKNNSPYEVALEFQQLVGEHGMTNDQVAKACGWKNSSSVSQYLSIFKADPRLQEAIKAEKINFSVFRHFSKLDRKVDTAVYEKMVEKALSGASAQDVGAAIDNFKTKQAAKAGDKSTKAPAKRGAAAHKKNKKAPALNLTDYRDPSVYKKMKPVKKKDMVDWLDTYRERTLQATTKAERTYNMGVLDGLEIATGLLVEE